MDVPAQPDDPLAQPTRARLFGLLCEIRRPASTEELAERLHMHPNGVRMHLDRLRDEGLVVRESSHQPRGRPRDMWHVSPEARPSGGPPTAYAQLGPWLARAIAPGKAGLRKIEATGRQIGRELAPDPAGTAESSLNASLAALGFQPRRESHLEGHLTYRLCNCPYREAASENPEAVCGLHRAITQGLIEALDPSSQLVEFVPGEPFGAGCLIEVSGPLASEGLEHVREAGPARDATLP
jgi:predicted ArsR family transcriptional regulator